MDINELMKQVSEAYDGIQHLQIQPTKTNLSLMTEVMRAMEEVYKYLDSQRKEVVE